MLKFLLLALFTFSAHAHIVISDLDDTIKITNSKELGDAAWNGLFSKKVFAGMPEFLSASKAGRTAMYVVTGSYSMVRPQVQDLMRQFKIEVNEIILRGNMLEPLFEYKVKRIQRLLDRHPTEEVVFFGDDVGKDPEVYEEIARANPGRVKAIYIRPVLNRPRLDGQISYVTAMDLALAETEEQRFPEAGLAALAASILKAKNSMILPDFTWCPRAMRGTGLPSSETDRVEAVAIVGRVEQICSR